MLPTGTWHCPICPGHWVNLKTWKTDSLKITSEWNGCRMVILTIHSALKLQGYHSRGTSHLKEEGPWASDSRDNLRQQTPWLLVWPSHCSEASLSKTSEAVSLSIKAGTRSRYLHFGGKILKCDHSPFANIWALHLKLSGVLCLQTIRQSWSLRDMSSPAESRWQLNMSKGSWGKLLLLHPGLQWGTKSAGRITEEFKNEE